jgi:TonB-linked SusC/RagA family outer membrane protein
MKFYAFTKATLGAWLPPQLLMVMKLTTLLFIIALVQASAKGYGQKINIDVHNVPIEKVFQTIEKQTGYVFFYDDNLIQHLNVSLQIKNGNIEDILNESFKDLPLSFNIIDQKNIVVRKRDESVLSRIMKYFTPLAGITGTVFDENGKPMPGVTIIDEQTKTGTVTASDGTYVMQANREDVLIFSFIGYKKKEIKLSERFTTGVYKGNNLLVNVSLEVNASDLEQVVVVGYGTTQRKDLTGSVSTVDAATVQDVPFTTIDNALAGKAAGVQVTKDDGTPGGAVRIRVRGSSSFLGGNDPLYVIDGVPLQVQSNYISPGYDVGSPVGNDVTGSGGVSAGMSTSFVNGLNSLGGLNIDDIESITILKDASSTGIYGSKAANGVVIITTKRGKKDMKPQITASYYSTVSTPVTPHVLDASQYKMLLTEAAQNDYNARTAAGLPIPDNDSAIIYHPSTFFGNANTNWIKEVTRNTVSDNAELSVQGGGNSSKYFSSVSYNSTPGVVDGTDFQRISGKINLENDISEKFRFISNVIMGYTNQNIGDGAYGQAIKARPDYTAYDALGNYTDFSQVGASYQGFLNPVALLSATNNAKTFSLLGSVSAMYDITKDLKFKSTGSLNMQTYNQRNYMPSYLDVGSFYGSVSNNGGIGSNSNSNSANWFIENTLSYTKKFNQRNSIDVVAGTSYETDKTSFFSATATGYPNDNVLTSLSSATTPLLVTGDNPTQPQNYLLSFYIRANYSYLDKYLFTFTGRSDASSKFGPDNKTGYFPSGAIAWRVSKEDFLKDIKWIDDIKLRGSYGLTGNQNIGNQMYRTLYSPYSYAGSSALIPTQLGNSGIKWESSREADGGLDISLFNGRLQATADYYNKQDNDALLSLPVAPSSSYTSVLSNSIGIKNTGVEVSLDGDIIRTRDFKWNASINVTWNNSVVTKLPSNADLGQLGDLTGLEYGNTTLVQGQPLGLITGMKVTGIIKTQAQLDAYKKELGPIYSTYIFPTLGIGDPMFELTPNSAGAYPNFNAVIAHAAPKYYGGFTQGFTYKNFDLQFYFTFSEGGELLWGDHIASEEFSGTANANVTILNRYTPTNTSTDEPRLLLNDALLYKSNLDVFSSSYVKLRTLTFDYHFKDTKWMAKAGMKSATLFASATNLFTITKYPGNDPETSDDAYSVTGGYFDVSNYPTVRTVSIGLKAGF